MNECIIYFHMENQKSQLQKTMRRNTLKPGKSPFYDQQVRRQKTFVSPELNQRSQRRASMGIQTNFMSEDGVIKDIPDVPGSRLKEELDKIDFRKVVDTTMDQWMSLLHNQIWQITPNGTFNSRPRQAELKHDEQPQSKIFDPAIGNDRDKKSKCTKTQSQTSLKLSRLKFNSQRKSTYLKRMSKASIPTHQSIMSKQNMPRKMPKLIPLKLDNIPQTPEGSTRRNLEDFLREKKINDEINLGYKIIYFEEKQNHLKMLQDLSKSSFLLMSTKNETSAQNSLKLPLIPNAKEDCNMDYDGGCIPLKKNSNMKKSAQILKTTCKIKNQIGEIKLTHPLKPKIQKFKSRQLTYRNESVNISTLLSTQEDVKSMIEKNFYTERVKFREMDPDQVTNIYGQN